MVSTLFRKNAIAPGLALLSLGALAPSHAAVIGSPGDDFYNLPSPLSRPATPCW